MVREENDLTISMKTSELIVGDIRDEAAVKRALKGIDAVYHFVASVGVGQSMYQIAGLHQRE